MTETVTESKALQSSFVYDYVGAHDQATYDLENRIADPERRIERFMESLISFEGATIADIGAGSGYLTVRLSPIVGPRGRIFAQDIEPSYLKDLGRRVKALNLKNVTVSLGEAHDPRLPRDSVDVAILVHMYHEISDPYALLYNLAPTLKRGGQVGIVDTRAATSRHGTPPALLACELAAVGYREVAVHSLSGSDAYLAIFSAPAPDARKRPAEIVACKAE